jgi:hypothetical protein
MEGLAVTAAEAATATSNDASQWVGIHKRGSGFNCQNASERVP